MKKKIIISVLAVLIAVSSCVGIAVNNNSKESETVSTTRSSTTATVHTTEENTASATETTKADNTAKKIETTKSTTEKSTSSKKQSGSSGSLKNNSQKQTTKKSTTTTKKETTTKAKSYAMTASEIRNYALNEIKKIDGTIYESEMNKNNAGWYTPVVVYPDDTEAEIKEALRMDAKGVYNGTTKNGYNIYVENTTDYNGYKCMKVYFLYGQALDPDIEL